MSDHEYKHDYRATLNDARRVLVAVRRIAMPRGYVASLFGSTVLVGEGHDVDVQVAGTQDEDCTPAELAMTIVRAQARQVFLWEQRDYGDVQDVWVSFTTRGGVYVDMHVKGSS